MSTANELTKKEYERYRIQNYNYLYTKNSKPYDPYTKHSHYKQDKSIPESKLKKEAKQLTINIFNDIKIKRDHD